MKKIFSARSSNNFSQNTKISTTLHGSSRILLNRKRFLYLVTLLVSLAVFTASCSGYDLRTVVSYRFRNLFGRFLRKGLILDRNPDPGNVGGIYRDAQGQEITFFVWRDSLATIKFYEKDEILPKRLEINWGIEDEINIRYQHLSEDGWSSVYANVEGMGELTKEERVALDNLYNHSMMQSLALIPLDLACQEDVVISDEQMAMLVYPLQLLFKYNIIERSVFAEELMSLSQCDYGQERENTDPKMTRIQMTPSSPVPAVMGYFPFDVDGAREVSSTDELGVKTACLDATTLAKVTTSENTAFLPSDYLLGPDPIRDEFGPCRSKCRGACGPDCTINNCTLTVDDRCELNKDGEYDGFRSLIFVYDCGLHPACIDHDTCYDNCNKKFGCDTWAASHCMHKGCDTDTFLQEDSSNVKDWVQGFGPQPIRQVFEYTDVDNDYEYDPFSCPVGEKPDVDENPIETQEEEEKAEVEESQQPDKDPQVEEIEETEEEKEEQPVQEADTEEAPTEESPFEVTEPEEYIDPCELLPINGVVMDQSPGYCRGEYNVEPYLSVIISLLEPDLALDEACQALNQESSTQVVEAVNYGDCGFVRLISFTLDKPTMDYHAGWDIVYIFDRFIVDIYTYDVYTTNKIWLENLALSVESNIRNRVK